MNKKYKKTSFSQSGEDLIISFIFNALKIKKPTYIDIGAYHPFHYSNTALLYKSGSSGINIEPDPTMFKLLIKYRKRDINLNIGIGEKQGVADYYRMNVPTLNTFSKSTAEKYRNEGDYFITDVSKIEISTLPNVINNYCDNIFPDFLNLDAEGIDETILKDLDLIQVKPKVICMETISFSTSGRGIKNTDLIQYLVQRDYMHYADTYINSIFVKKNLWMR
jgi:FkbM family methyltransferase